MFLRLKCLQIIAAHESKQFRERAYGMLSYAIRIYPDHPGYVLASESGMYGFCGQYVFLRAADSSARVACLYTFIQIQSLYTFISSHVSRGSWKRPMCCNNATHIYVCVTYTHDRF